MVIYSLAVGNKADLEAQRQVSTMEGKELAKTLGIPFMEASAKVRPFTLSLVSSRRVSLHRRLAST